MMTNKKQMRRGILLLQIQYIMDYNSATGKIRENFF